MKKLNFLILIAAAACVACSSADKKTEDKLDRQVKAQPPANSADEIGRRAAEAFSNAPDLNESQKSDLLGIYLRVYAEANAIRTEMGQAKGLLFQKIADPNYKKKEIAFLKKKIVDLDHRRLDIMFKALDDVQKIVGQSRNSYQIYRHFQENEYPHSPFDNRGGYLQ